MLLARALPRLRRLGGEQSGVAVPVAVWVLLVVLLFLAAAAGSAVWAVSQTTSQRASQRALAAADGALDVAMAQLNGRGGGTVVAANRCPGGETPTDGWCDVGNAGTQLDNGATASYRISVEPPLSDGRRWRRIVAHGSSGDRTRRVTANVVLSGSPLFDIGVLGLDAITVNATTGHTAWLIAPRIGSNGTLQLQGANSPVCGRVQANPVNYGGTANPSANLNCPSLSVSDPDRPNPLYCAGTGSACVDTYYPEYSFAKASPEPHLQPTSTRELAPLNNQWISLALQNAGLNIPDGRWCNAGQISDSLPVDMTASYGSSPSNIDWNCEERTLTLRGDAYLILSSGNYAFCGLEIQGSARLEIPAGSRVNIWMDDASLEHNSGTVCTVATNRPLQLFRGTAGIVNPGSAGALWILGMGVRPPSGSGSCSGSDPTALFWQGGVAAAIAVGLRAGVYAPAWCVQVGQTGSTPRQAIEGAVIARDIQVVGAGRIVWDESVNDRPGSDAEYLRMPNSWRECPPAAGIGGANPTSGCP